MSTIADRILARRAPADAGFPRAPSMGSQAQVGSRIAQRLVDLPSAEGQARGRERLPEVLQSADLETGAPASIRSGLSFQKTPKEKLDYLKREYGDDNAVMVDNGDAFFVRDADRQWLLVTPVKNFTDIAGSAREAVKLAPQIAASVATQNPAAASAASLAGDAVADITGDLLARPRGAVKSARESKMAEWIRPPNEPAPSLAPVGEALIAGTLQGGANLAANIKALTPTRILRAGIRSELAGEAAESVPRAVFRTAMGQGEPALATTAEREARQSLIDRGGYRATAATALESPLAEGAQRVLSQQDTTRKPFLDAAAHNVRRLGARREAVVAELGPGGTKTETGNRVKALFDRAGYFAKRAQNAARILDTILHKGPRRATGEAAGAAADAAATHVDNAWRAMTHEVGGNIERAVRDIDATGFQFTTENYERALKEVADATSPAAPAGGVGDRIADNSRDSLGKLKQSTEIKYEGAQRDAKGRFVSLADLPTHRNPTAREFQTALSEWGGKVGAGDVVRNVSPEAESTYAKRMFGALMDDLSANIARGEQLGVPVESLRAARDAYRDAVREELSTREFIRRELFGSEAPEAIVNNLASNREPTQIRQFIIQMNKVDPELSREVRQQSLEKVFFPAYIQDPVSNTRSLDFSEFLNIAGTQKERISALLADSSAAQKEMRRLTLHMSHLANRMNGDAGRKLVAKTAEDLVDTLLRTGKPDAVRAAMSKIAQSSPETYAMLKRHGAEKILASTDVAGEVGVASGAKVARALASKRNREFLDALVLGNKEELARFEALRAEGKLIAQESRTMSGSQTTPTRIMKELLGTAAQIVTGNKAALARQMVDIYSNKNMAKLLSAPEGIRAITDTMRFPVNSARFIRASEEAVRLLGKDILTEADDTRIQNEHRRRETLR